MSRGQPRVFGEAGEGRGFERGRILVVVLVLVSERLSGRDDRCVLWRLDCLVA